MSTKRAPGMSRLRTTNYVYPNSQLSQTPPKKKRTDVPPPLTPLAAVATFSSTASATKASQNFKTASLKGDGNELLFASKPRTGAIPTEKTQRATKPKVGTRNVTIRGPRKSFTPLTRKQSQRLAKFRRYSLKAEGLKTTKKPVQQMSQPEFRQYVEQMLATIFIAVAEISEKSHEGSDKDIDVITSQTMKKDTGKHYLGWIAYGGAPGGAFVPPFSHTKELRIYFEGLAYEGEILYADRVQRHMDTYWQMVKDVRDHIDQRKLRIFRKGIKQVPVVIDAVRQRMLKSWTTSNLPTPEEGLFAFSTILAQECGIAKQMQGMFEGYGVNFTPRAELCMSGIMQHVCLKNSLDITKAFEEVYKRAQKLREEFSTESQDWTSI